MKKILSEMGLGEPLSITPFENEEGAGEYAVWKVEYADHPYVLKRAKGKEFEIYERYLKNAPIAPALVAKGTVDGQQYLLLEYVEGENLMCCNGEKLIAAIDALTEMQDMYWNCHGSTDGLASRRNRRNYLQNELLERVYDAYLRDCEQIPWTFCHDDLLPFNVLVSGNRAVLIDWEVAGILPYPASLARLIAHTSEEPDALFFMKETDIAAAVDRYYQRLLAPKGICFNEFQRSFDLHLFYEYCEWVYVGNKFGGQNSELFLKYSDLAINMAKKLIPHLH